MDPSFITKKLKQIKIKLSLQIFQKKDEIENILKIYRFYRFCSIFNFCLMTFDDV